MQPLSKFQFLVELEYLNEGIIPFSIIRKNDKSTIESLFPIDANLSRKMKRKFRKLKRKAKKKTSTDGHGFSYHQRIVQQLIEKSVIENVKNEHRQKSNEVETK